MKANNRGSLELFVEMLVIVILLIAFLIATHARDAFRKDQEAARAVYPNSVEKMPSGDQQKIPGIPLVGDPNEPKPKAYTQPGGMTEGSYTEILYTDKGFVPSTVKLDEKYRVVVFRNQSSRTMWVASDPYPMNNNLPILNEGFGVTKNGVYWFAFPSGPKTYTYHNELFPTHHGTVIVK
jgi:hypothetical protein